MFRPASFHTSFDHPADIYSGALNIASIITMAEIHDKENISPRRSSRSPHKLSFESPAKGTRKSRSNSIGPGSEARSPHKTKSPAKDRRKSSFVPVVKSILPSKEDEAKRREARRKSLGTP